MDNEERIVVLNKYADSVDASIVQGALEAAGISAGVIGDSFANNLWKEAYRVVVFRRDLEMAIKALYNDEMRYEDYQEEMDLHRFEKMRECNKIFCELALKIHPELGGKDCRDLYAQARLAYDAGDLETLEKMRDSL